MALRPGRTQLTADCEPLLDARLVVVLEEAPDGVARDSEGDDAGGCVDVGDRVGRHQAAVAGETAAPDRERIGDVRERAVHRTFDAADDSPMIVGDDEARGRAEVGCDCAHRLNVFLVCKEIPFTP
jgi:hypothetical protein